MTADRSVRKALEDAFGPPIAIKDEATPEIESVWTVGEVEVALAEKPANDARLGKVWRERRGKRPTPLLLVAESTTGIRALGPNDADGPVRQVSSEALVRALKEIEPKPRRAAAATLADILERADRTGIPGIVIRGLLTKHVLTKRLRKYHADDWDRLEQAANKVKAGRDWKKNLSALGYRADPRKEGGYLLSHDDQPLAVVLPLARPDLFSKATEDGRLPEGILVSACNRERVQWGLLAADSRFRLFPASSAVGSATARYLELDIDETEPGDWTYIGLLAPESLQPGGILEQLVAEVAALGNELRDKGEQRIREEVLPSVARGLGAWISRPPRKENLASPNVRQTLEEASLLLLFRVLFFLYLESRGYLPLSSPAYGPHSATQLVQDARADGPDYNKDSHVFWNRFRTLVDTMRSGNTSWGLPAYDGDLFAAGGIDVASELLDEAELTDPFFGAALARLASDPEGEEELAGVDYGDLEIDHLGRIYEGLLGLRLSFAEEPMAFDPRIERWVPAGKEEPEVGAGDLFYQSESGGRKAGGVYYTPQVIVRHLVDRAVMPALEEHLAVVEALANKDPKKAAAHLFEFRVLDPAMGSAHFLADAMDRIAERMAVFLAEHPLKAVTAMLDDLRKEARWPGRIEDGDLFRRLVLKRCIYGVDLSQMAVEVGKVSLWLGSFVPGLSLAYLGHNLKQGDSLVGVADTAVLEDLGPVFVHNPTAPIPKALAKAREMAREVVETPDRTPDEVKESRAAQERLDRATENLTRVFDLWCTEPFGLKAARDWMAGAADKLLAGEPVKGEEKWTEPAGQMGRDRNFFHWPAEFPEVFMRTKEDTLPEELKADAHKLFAISHQMGLGDAAIETPGGFDVVIGNPPWEELTIEELAFYALHDPGLRGIKAEADRRKRIDALAKRYPYLKAEFEKHATELEGKRRFFGPAGGYFNRMTGDTDLYKLFSERYGALSKPGGWLGVVLPRSAFLTDGNRGFRTWLFGKAEVRRIDFILNAARWAFDMEPRYTLGLLSARRVPPAADSAMRTTGPSASQKEFEAASATGGNAIPIADLARWTKMDGGSGYEVPLLPSPESVAVFDKMRAGPLFFEGYEGAWSAFPVAELHETADKSLFKHKAGVPVWKGRSFEQYDPHGADPAGYAKGSEAITKLQSKRTSANSAFKKHFDAEALADAKTHPFYSARIAFRDVTRATDSRTVRACLVPPEIFLTNSAPYLVFPEGDERQQAFVLGVLDSLPFDWQARRFVETHMNFFVAGLLCFPPPDAVDAVAIASRAARLSCVDERFTDFAKACKVKCGPLDPDERDRLIAEIDALVARAYGLSAADLEVVFSDFTLSAVPESHRQAIRQSLKEVR